MNAFDDLVQIVARLRGPGGCPWDQAQTPESFRPYLLEEAFEAVDAIDRQAWAELKKELGDVMFQVVMLARMAQEAGHFQLEDVLAQINDKMVRRHPHVFDPSFEGRPEEASTNEAWERRKAAERPEAQSVLEGVPRGMPALLRAHRISDKAAAVGFDWPNVAAVRDKVGEELTELDQALVDGSEARILEEYGDLLFALVNLGRHLPAGAEAALRKATSKFEGRFRKLEAAVAAEGESIYHTSAEALEAHWQAVKSKEGDP